MQKYMNCGIIKEKTDRYIENCRNVTFDTAEKYCEKILKIYGDK